jgi:hypothetical protein
VARVYEMAWVGTVSLVDGAGEALHTIRYGATGVAVVRLVDFPSFSMTCQKATTALFGASDGSRRLAQ